MKARLGDDLESGWLLLGSPGVQRDNGLSISSAAGGSTALSSHPTPGQQAAAAILSGVVGGAGVPSGGPLNPRAPVQQR